MKFRVKKMIMVIIKTNRSINRGAINKEILWFREEFKESQIMIRLLQNNSSII